jgi:hypothetical protein
MTPEEIIEGAIRELDKNGWCQSQYTDPLTGAHCALGALAVAQGAEGQYSAYEDAEFILQANGRTQQDVLALREAASMVAHKLSKSIPSYLEPKEAWTVVPGINDRSSTTEEDVKLAMKRALHDDAE